MKQLLGVLIAASWIFGLHDAMSANASPPPSPEPVPVQAGPVSGGFSIGGTVRDPGHPRPGGVSTGGLLRSVVLPCSSPNLPSSAVAACDGSLGNCRVQVLLLPPALRVGVVPQVTVTVHPDGSAQVYSTDCEFRPGAVVPVVSPGVARAQVVRLLPRSVVGVAPVDHVTLVRIDTLFWVPTAVDLDLGSVMLLGQRVGLRAHLKGVDWSFGDGVSVHSAGPGVPFPRGGPCRTVHCPAYFSHDYAHVGSVAVSAKLTWAGQFRVGDGAWQDIAQTVPVMTPAVAVTVRQARGVLTS